MLLFTSPNRVGLVDVVAKPRMSSNKSFSELRTSSTILLLSHPRAHSPALSSLTSPSSYPPPSPSPVRVNVNHAAITVYDRFGTQTVTAFENGPCHVDVVQTQDRVQVKQLTGSS